MPRNFPRAMASSNNEGDPVVPERLTSSMVGVDSRMAQLLGSSFPKAEEGVSRGIGFSATADGDGAGATEGETEETTVGGTERGAEVG